MQPRRLGMTGLGRSHPELESVIWTTVGSVDSSHSSPHSSVLSQSAHQSAHAGDAAKARHNQSMHPAINNLSLAAG